jgi:hypothetical protein
MSNWTLVANQLNGQIGIECLTVFEGELYGGPQSYHAVTGFRLFKLNAAKNSWVQVCDSLYGSAGGVYALYVYNGRLYAGGDYGNLARLNLAKDDWESIGSIPGPDLRIKSFVEYHSRLYAGSANYGNLFRMKLTEDGLDLICPQFNGEQQILSLIVFEDRLYGGTNYHGRLYRNI